MDTDFEIIVGTYEEFLLGYRVLQNSEDKSYKIDFTFTNHSHSASVRAVAAVGKFVVSGGADEAMRILNLKARVEHGYLQAQSGTITCITNYGASFLFSGCEDGSICIWKSGSWICEKTLKAHEGGVTGISVHPSGKLALSVGRDGTLKTWNLIKGRTGYVTNLHGVADVVQWSPKGTYYAVGIDNRVDVYRTESAKVVYSIPFNARVCCICFASDKRIIVGGNKSSVEVHSIETSQKLMEFVAHEKRVKDMKFVKKRKWLITGSNCDQKIKAWSIPKNSTEPELRLTQDTTCRITCFTIWDESSVSSETVPDEEMADAVPNVDQEKKSLKRKRKRESESDKLSIHKGTPKKLIKNSIKVEQEQEVGKKQPNTKRKAELTTIKKAKSATLVEKPNVEQVRKSKKLKSKVKPKPVKNT